MNSFTFDLSTETRPLFRAGIHGLARLLSLCEGNPRYPGVCRTPGLDWSLTDTAVTILWREYADLSPVMQSMLGDFHHGIGVPPGYEQDPDKDGFYVTIRQHQGIVPIFREKKSSQFRSVSLGSGSSAKKPEREVWTAQHGHPPVERISTLTRPHSDSPLEISVTPHMWARNMSVTGADGKPLKIFTTSSHPALSQWNVKGIKATPSEIFVISFACLSYVFTCANDGSVGLAVDAPTFSEAAGYHRRWNRGDEPRNTLWVTGDEHTALWVIAASLRLPEGMYPSLKPSGVGLFRVGGQDIEGVDKLYDALGAALEPASKNGYLRRTCAIPVSNRVSDKKPLDLFLDFLVRNMENSRPFYVGMDGIYTNPRHLRKDEHTLISTIGDLLMTPVEAKVANWMRDLFRSLGKSYTRQNKRDAWGDARKFAISTHLTRAANRSGILDAINAVVRESGSDRIPEEVFSYLWTRSYQNPGEVRALLILSCGLDGKLASTDTSVLPAPSEPDENE